MLCRKFELIPTKIGFFTNKTCSKFVQLLIVIDTNLIVGAGADSQ